MRPIVLLFPDHRHTKIAELYGADDPLHVLHSALGTNDPSLLLEWARGLVDNLEDSKVRSVLSRIEPGVFGAELQSVIAEACLSMKDLASARTALSCVHDDSGLALTQWMETLDQNPGAARKLPADIGETLSPRAFAETAILYFLYTRHLNTKPAEPPLAMLAGGKHSIHRVSDLSACDIKDCGGNRHRFRQE